MTTVDINSIDLRLKHLRIDNSKRKEELLGSIAQIGIQEPCLCINADQHLLLDGFKRYWCACKLSLDTIPVTILAQDEAPGLMRFIRFSKANQLNTLEQARILDELNSIHKRGVRELARLLDCSPAWVSLRLGMLREMSPVVRDAIFSGKFPVRSYMHTLRVFTRVNTFSQDSIDKFVKNISGKNLSTRDTDKLIQAYFTGNKEIKDEINSGNCQWVLSQIKKETALPLSTTDKNDDEKKAIKELELLQVYLFRVCKSINNVKLQTSSVIQTACLLSCSIHDNLDELKKQLRIFNDRRRHQKNSTGSVQNGKNQ